MNDLLNIDENAWSRRGFLKGATLTSLGALVASGQWSTLVAQDTGGPADTEQQPVNIGLIGCGVHGREILATLERIPNAHVVAISETYDPWMFRAGRLASGAKKYKDYVDLLSDETVQAVIVATPTHQHREIALAAFEAGKHVYLEAPIAHTIEDAKAITQAADAKQTIYYQPGLQLRSEPQRSFLLPFIRAGAIGDQIKVNAQWHKKTSLRRASPNAQRERELNWRLDAGVSTGLVGETGIHQIDNVNWFMNQWPTAVNGSGNILHWDDGRNVSDTVRALFEYPNGAQFNYEATIGNSFDADYEMYYGSDCAIMFRENKSWMFKEADAPLLGWEVYARKDKFYKETGIYLVANATKLTTQDESATDASSAYTKTALHYALEAFVYNAYVHNAAVVDYIDAFGADQLDFLSEYLSDVASSKLDAATLEEGYRASALAIVANEAVKRNERIELAEDIFDFNA